MHRRVQLWLFHVGGHKTSSFRIHFEKQPKRKGEGEYGRRYRNKRDRNVETTKRIRKEKEKEKRSLLKIEQKCATKNLISMHITN